MTTALLDANVLIALVVADHVHHDRAAEWLAASDLAIATCPITEGEFGPVPHSGWPDCGCGSGSRHDLGRQRPA